MNDTKQQPDIYISYAHRDGQALADTLYQALCKRGYSVFYVQDISPGQMWAEALSQKIRDCSMFLLILTPEAVRTRFVWAEVRFALQENRNVIAITTEDPGSILQENPNLQFMLLDRRVQVISEKAPDAVLARLDEILPAKTQKQPAPEPLKQERSTGYDFFLSYCHADGGEYAKRLQAELEARGHSVFHYDQLDIEGNWGKTLTDAIAHCGTFVMIVSPLAFTNKAFSTEFNMACTEDKTIVPIRIGGFSFEGQQFSYQAKMLQANYECLDGDALSVQEIADRLCGGAPAEKLQPPAVSGQYDIVISAQPGSSALFAEALHRELQERGYAVISYDGTSGADTPEQIEKQLRQCTDLVLILSEHGLESDFVTAEIRAALNMHKNIIPVAIDSGTQGSAKITKAAFLLMGHRKISVNANSIRESFDCICGLLTAPRRGKTPPPEQALLPAPAPETPVPEPETPAPSPQSPGSAPVFISYSSKNSEYAIALRAILTQEGIPCWMAPDSIPAGMRYMQAIVDAIDECSSMVIIVTSESQNSEQVEREINLMISDYPKKLVCALITDGNPLKGWMRLALQNRQIETAEQVQKGDRGTDRLIASLKKLYPQTPEDRAVKSDISEHRDEARGTARTKEPDAASKPERSSAPSESVSRNLSHAPAIPAQASQTAAEKPPRQQKAAAVYIAAIPAHAAEKAALCDILKRAGIPFCSAPERILTGTQFSPANIAQIGACAAAVVLGNSSSMDGAGTDSIKRLLLSLKKPCYSLLFGTGSTYWENRSTRFDTFIHADKIVPGDRGTDRLIAALRKLY